MPFHIHNALDCDIDGTWEVRAQGSGCTGSCDSGTFTAFAYSTWVGPQFSGCTPEDEVDCIIITITMIGTTMVNIPPINSNTVTLSSQVSLNNPAPGCTTPSTYHLMNDPNNLHINP